MLRLKELYGYADTLSLDGKQLLERYINVDGVIVGWGLCRDGELGTGNRYNVLTPMMIGGRDKPIRMACSGLSSIWLGIRNINVTMGSGMWGELGIGNPIYCPQVIANEINMPICPGQVEVIRPNMNTVDNNDSTTSSNKVANTKNHDHNLNMSSSSNNNNNNNNNNIFIDAQAGFAYIACTSLHGGVYVWGANNYAQCHPDLNNICCGYPQLRVIEDEVVVEVATANYAILARTLRGNMYGWGLSFLLGKDDNTLRALLQKEYHTNTSSDVDLATATNTPDVRRIVPIPVKLDYFSNEYIKHIRAGPWHFAAITTTTTTTTTRTRISAAGNDYGKVYTWGLGNNGRLGHGNEEDQLEPKCVEALRSVDVIEVACGSFHTVFVTADGRCFACGDNRCGQCGVIGQTTIGAPVEMKVLHFLYNNIDSSYSRNNNNNSNNYNNSNYTSTMESAYRPRVIHACCGRHHTNLLLNTGEVLSYGSGVALGVGGGYGIRCVRNQAILLNFTSLWMTSGPVHCFALTIPKATMMTIVGVPHRGVPAVVNSIALKEGIISCGVGAGFTVLVSRRGSSYAFGVGGWGQLGCELASSSASCEFTLERVPVLPQVTRIGYFARTCVCYVAAGFSFAMAIIEGERVYAWGNNSYGQCGLGADPHTFQRITQPREITWLADKAIVQVACGSYFALALSASGSVFSWGVIECCGHGLQPTTEVVPVHFIMNRVGPDNRKVILSPTKIISLEHIIQIAAGDWHALALNAIGEIYVWGVGTGGRLGLNVEKDVYLPTQIKHSAFFTRIGAGCYTSYGIDEDAKLYLWGVNDKSQLGISGKVHTPTFVMENVRDVGLGKYFTLVLTYDGLLHLAGMLETEQGTYRSTSFHNTDNLPESIKPTMLQASNMRGIRIFCGLEHAIVLLENGLINSRAIEEVTIYMRERPAAIVKNYYEEKSQK